MRRLFNFRTTTVVLLALILSAVVYGFAAANTVPDSYAGEGTSDVSGYVISNIHYIVGVTPNPATIVGVSFTTAPAVPVNGTVYVVADDGAIISTLYVSDTCTGLGTENLTCGFLTNTITVPDIAHLRIVAAQ